MMIKTNGDCSPQQNRHHREDISNRIEVLVDKKVPGERYMFPILLCTLIKVVYGSGI